WSSFGLALAAGAWVAAREPDQHLFEQGVRALGLTGPMLGPLDALTSIAVAFAAMLAVYVLAFTAIGLATSRRGPTQR
ncbi:MAG: hypothetical protein O2895_07130, partial [Chloroflexi bacterium]|nr:hypothetical protein [Chloroflexota bacterium]